MKKARSLRAVDGIENWSSSAKCNWRGLSRDAAGGNAIADTGDFDDVICPKCGKNVEEDNGNY